jgi:hypothetical protein
VEIGGNLFTVRKANVGRVLQLQWIVGGLCLETGEYFFVKVPNRSAGTPITDNLGNVEEDSSSTQKTGADKRQNI